MTQVLVKTHAAAAKPIVIGGRKPPTAAGVSPRHNGTSSIPKPKGQNTRKVANGSVPPVEATASVTPKAKTVVDSGRNSRTKMSTGDGKSSAAESQTTGKSGPVKADMVLKKLRSVRGVTIAQIMEMTGWQAHSVRGFLSGVVKKKFRLDLVSEAGKDGLRRYRIAEREGSQSRDKPRARKNDGDVGGTDSTIAEGGDAGVHNAPGADGGAGADSRANATGNAGEDGTGEASDGAAPSSAFVTIRKA